MEEDHGIYNGNSDDSESEEEEALGSETASRRNSVYGIPTPVTIGLMPETHQDFPAGFDITCHWHKYKLNSLAIANKQNLHISSDIQKVM